MKNFKKLSREELKNTFGGLKACKLVIKQPNGTYVTEYGTCDAKVIGHNNYGNYGGAAYATTQSFCNLGDGEMHNLTSNGGHSRC